MPSNRSRGRPPFPDVLTPAEWRVIEAVRHGMRNRQIAERQGVSIDAAKYHIANSLQKLGLERRSDLRTWGGVARSSALHSQETNMSAVPELGAIGQIARRVADISAARIWYGEVLGLAHLYSFGDLAFFDCGGVRLFLSGGEEGGGGDESILYFKVADIRASHADMTARGIVFTNAPHMIHRHADGTEEWMAFFRDNEGRDLALMSQVRP